MDQTFYIFLILFAILIIYLFQQKKETENFENFKNSENLNQLPENIKIDENIRVEVNDITPNIQLNPQPDEYQEPVPMNKPDTPVGNGYSTSLIFNHPDKINGCDITNIAPMNYFKEMNQKINQQFKNKVMNGGNFGNVTGNLDESEEGYYYY